MTTLCLGTVQLGLHYGINNKVGMLTDEQAFEVLDAAYEAGFRAVDTAPAYGESERRIAADLGTLASQFDATTAAMPRTMANAPSPNMAVLKRAFPKSVTMQYANFMPGNDPLDKDRSNLRDVYQRAKELRVGVGGPDLLPYKPGQMHNSYPLLRELAGSVPTGIAVQDGNYEHNNPKTGKQVTIPELVGFGSEYLKVDYIFWCTQEPFYSKELIPFLQARK